MQQQKDLEGINSLGNAVRTFSRPSASWSRFEIRDYLEFRGFAVYEDERREDLLRAAQLDWDDKETP